MIEEPLTRETPLPFEIDLVDGSKVKTVGDVETYLRNLKDDQHRDSHWGIAVRMFANPMREPAYLKTGHFRQLWRLTGCLCGCSSPAARPPPRPCIPETKQGGDQRGANRQKGGLKDSFAKDIAVKSGKPLRTVERDITRGRK
jgi:hypothetical protein